MTRVSTPFSQKEVLPSRQSVNHDIVMENKASHLHLYVQTVKKRQYGSDITALRPVQELAALSAMIRPQSCYLPHPPNRGKKTEG